MTKKYRSDPEKPSDMFVDSICCGFGSYEMECGWCGRLHLCPDTTYDPPDYDLTDSNDSYSNRFRQYCLDEYENNKEGVILHYGVDCVSGRSLCNINFVVDCPCNGLKRYEDFIWEERDSIRSYLKKRIDQELEWAEQEKTRNKLAGI